MTGAPDFKIEKIKWYIVLLFALWPAILVNPFGTVMSDIVLQTSVNIVDHGQVELAPTAGFDLMLLNGKFYSGFPPGASWLAVPFYFVFKPLISILPNEWALLSGVKGQGLKGHDHVRTKEVYFLQLFMVWFFVAPLFGWTIWRFMDWMNTVTNGDVSFAFLSACTLAFGGILLHYAACYSRQLLSTLFMLLAFLYFLKHRSSVASDRRGHFFHAFLLAFVVTIEHQTAVAALAIAIYGFTHLQNHKAKWIYAACFILPLVLNLIYYKLLIGTWFESPYSYRAIYAPEYRGVVKGFGEIFHSDIMTQFSDFELPSLEKLYELTFGSFKGLFYFSVALALGLMALPLWYKNYKRELAVIAVVILSGFLINLIIRGKVYWSGGGFFWGPRFLLWAGAFMIFGWQFYARYKSAKWLFGFCAGISILINFAGAMFFHRTRVRSTYESPHDILFPIPKTLHLLFSEFPEIPLLYHYGISKAWQIGVFAVAGILTLFLLFLLLSAIFLKKGDRFSV